MHLILTRHGQTIENAQKILMGHNHGTLSETGIEQAKKLAQRLKNQKIDIIYSSDLMRTLDTAKEIAKYHPQAKIITDKRLRERFLGRYQGLPHDTISWTNVPDDVESDEDMCKKLKGFIDEIYKKHKDETVLVASHSGTKMALLTILFNKPYFEMKHFEGIKNTAISKFDLGDDGIEKIHIINCARHIE
jgi:broad specificity phosphatase PhoE